MACAFMRVGFAAAIEETICRRSSLVVNKGVIAGVL
jgi:hypothetical protein